MKINVSDFVTTRDKSISGQVMEIMGNRAVIIDDASEYDYPENCLEFELTELDPVSMSHDNTTDAQPVHLT